MPKPLVTAESFIPLEGVVHYQYTLGVNYLELNIPLNCETILVQAIAQNIRYTLNGHNPTTASGFQLKAGDPPRLLRVGKGSKFKFIRETSGAILELEYGGPESISVIG